MSNPDPWAAAQASAGSTTTATAGESQIMPEDGAESQLFGGGGVSYPSLFNKTHALGTVRTGIITKVTDVHSRTFSTDGPGELKYWQEGEKSPVTKPVNPATGKPNRPVMDTHIELDTDYRITEAECVAINRKPEFVQQDEGKRVFAAGGFDYKVTQAALQDAIPKLSLRKTADLIGKRLTVKRAGQHSNPGGNPSWVLEVIFSAS